MTVFSILVSFEFVTLCSALPEQVSLDLEYIARILRLRQVTTRARNLFGHLSWRADPRAQPFQTVQYNLKLGAYFVAALVSSYDH